MDYLAIALLVIGLAGLVVGYRKNNRNVLVVSALLLFASVALPDFIAGYLDGFHGADKTAASTSAG